MRMRTRNAATRHHSIDEVVNATTARRTLYVTPRMRLYTEVRRKKYTVEAAVRQAKKHSRVDVSRSGGSPLISSSSPSASPHSKSVLISNSRGDSSGEVDINTGGGGRDRAPSALASRRHTRRTSTVYRVAPSMSFHSLNEVLIDRGITPALGALELFIDGKYTTTVQVCTCM